MKGVCASSQMAPHKFVLPPSSDEDDELSPGPGLGEEEGGGSRVEEQVGARAVILPAGTILDAKRLRTHSPPPLGWKWTPDVVMGDGATAADLAVAKVFSDGLPLPDILGAEGALREFSARTLLPLCSCGATSSVCLRLRKDALRIIAQVLSLLRRLLLQLTWNGVVSTCQMIRLMNGLTKSPFA